MRDDFSVDTKKRLAKRVGYLCSFPNCGSLTIGPSEESEKSTSSVGTACHIAAASSGKGARRYVEEMTSDERLDISNGIWMCEKHGKLIDTDESRFTIEVLKSWKTLAEEVAKSMLENGYDYETALKLMRGKNPTINEIRLTEIGFENDLIGNLIFDSCIAVVWGEKLADSIRDFAIEHSRNSFLHGSATVFEIRIYDNKLIISDNGNAFNPRDLLKIGSQTGGAMSLNYLLQNFGDKIVFTTQRINNTNQTIISAIRETKEILEVTPCSAEISLERFHSGNNSITITTNCNEFYVVLPHYFSLSDVYNMPRKFPQFNNSLITIIFVVERISDHVISIILKNYPNSQIINIQ